MHGDAAGSTTVIDKWKARVYKKEDAEKKGDPLSLFLFSR